MKQYKDELLGACLELVLSVPKQFVDIEQFLPSLSMAFKLGLSHLPMATIALDAVEYWRKVKRKELVQELPRILPCMNEYLTVHIQDDGADDEDTDAFSTVSGTKRNSNAGKKRRDEEKEPAQSLRTQVQLRIVRLLAKLGGDSIHLIKVCYQNF